MSKTIEFVERKIKDKKDQLKRLENLKTISNKYGLQINELLTKNTEEDIEHLEQIKCELEAWEIVKEYTDTSEDIVNTEYCFIKGIDDEFETLKKALEVQNANM